jgi:hypothetical protein
MTCREFFELHSGNREKVKELQKLPEKTLIWETESASEHSPGPVKNDEVLCRQVMQPLHVDLESKTLRPTAFEDAANKGLSIERIQFRSVEEIMASGVERIAARANAASGARNESLFALAKLNASRVRAIVAGDGKRAFGIYDTALPENRAHGDVCQLLGGKQIGRSIRSQLIDVVEEMVEA